MDKSFEQNSLVVVGTLLDMEQGMTGVYGCVVVFHDLKSCSRTFCPAEDSNKEKRRNNFERVISLIVR